MSIRIEKDYPGVSAKLISESAHAKYLIYAKGTGLNRNTNRVLKVNDTTIYNTTGRGIRLSIFDTNMTLLSDVRYDVYGYATERTALANAIDSMNDDRIFVMTSYDAINTNVDLTAAMQGIGSQLWDSSASSRRPYACVGVKRIGITAEQIWGTGSSDPYAEIYWTYEDYDTAGAIGYGPILYSHTKEASYTGTGYQMLTSPGLYIPSIGLKDGEYLRLTGEMKINKARYDAGGEVRAYIWTRTAGDSWVRSTSTASSSLQWERFNLYFRRDDAESIAVASDGGIETFVYASVYHFPNSIDEGTSYVRNLQLQKVGFAPNTETTTKVSEHVISSFNIIEGPRFHPTLPYTYYELAKSNRNLIKDYSWSRVISGEGAVDEDVRWFDYTLTNCTEKVIMWKETTNTSGQNMYRGTGWVSIDPNKYYYTAVWMYSFKKYRGSNYVRIRTADPADTSGRVINAVNGAVCTNPYYWMNSASNIDKNKWCLIDSFILPCNSTNADGAYWSELRMSQFGDYHNTVKGYNCAAVNRFATDDTRTYMRLLDYYNDTSTTKTWWALPLICEIPPMAIRDRHLLVNILKENL